MSKSVRVLLVCASSARAARWSRILSRAGWHICGDVSAVPARAALTLIVTDRELRARDVGHARHEALLAAGEIGVVAVGVAGPADVRLPARVTPRELRLACALLAETVRLRRERNRTRQRQQQLRRAAHSDPLTGLPNRRAWEEELRARAHGDQQPAGVLGVAILDLDRFKRVNERFGYLAGDEVLRHVSRRLQAAAGDAFVARLGGDEFGVLVAASRSSAAVAVVERLRNTLVVGCPHIAMTASGGVVCCGPAGREAHAEREALPPSALIAAADKALRRAKSAGRNRTVRAPCGVTT